MGKKSQIWICNKCHGLYHRGEARSSGIVLHFGTQFTPPELPSRPETRLELLIKCGIPITVQDVIDSLNDTLDRVRRRSRGQ